MDYKMYPVICNDLLTHGEFVSSLFYRSIFIDVLIKVSLLQICYTKLACKALGVFCNANDDILAANASAISDVDTDITESWCESKMISKKGRG